MDYPPGHLVIGDVRRGDQGSYVCVAKNEAGERRSETAQLAVLGVCHRLHSL